MATSQLHNVAAVSQGSGKLAEAQFQQTAVDIELF
jgi:hypothetical protein